MSRTIMMNLTGQRYGRLTVLSRVPNQGEKVCWRCVCDCGNETNVQTYNLVFGLTKSCGCYRRERASEVHGKGRDKGFSAIKDMSASSPVILGDGTLYRKTSLRYTNEGSTTITLSGTYIQVRLSSAPYFARGTTGIIYIGTGSPTSNSYFPNPGTITDITSNYAISTKYVVNYLDPLIGVINSSESCISSTSFTAECSIMYIHDSSRYDPIGRCSAKIYNTTYEILEYTLYEKNGKIPIVNGKSTMDGDIRIIIHHVI